MAKAEVIFSARSFVFSIGACSGQLHIGLAQRLHVCHKAGACFPFGMEGKAIKMCFSEFTSIKRNSVLPEMMKCTGVLEPPLGFE